MTRLSVRAAALVALLALPGARAEACDSTGCLLLTRGQNGVLGRGDLRLDVSFRYSDVRSKLAGSRDAATVLRPRVDYERRLVYPDYHEELGGDETYLQLDAAYGLGARTTLYASLPLAGNRDFRMAHGAVTTPYDVWGLGDPQLGVRQVLMARNRSQLVASLGVEFPLGSTSLVDPFDSRPLDPWLQPGSGAFGAYVAAQASFHVVSPRLDWTASGSYQASSTNEHGYRFGNEAIGALGVGKPLGRFGLTAQVKAFHRGRDSFDGRSVAATGGTVVYASAGGRVQLGRSSLYAVYQLPVYRYVNETQLAARAGLLIGVARTF
jgi:hypothetical protein